MKRSIKIGLATALTICALNASENTNELSALDQKVIKAEQGKIAGNPNVQLKKLGISFKKELSNGWTGYIMSIDILVKDNIQTVKDTVYTNGKEFVNRLYDLETGNDYLDKMTPPMSQEYYKKEYLISGNENAAHKMVLFSDPLCPVCVDVVPGLINKVKMHPNDVALYYIPFPLSMHPTSGTIVKASIIAKKEGIKDVSYKVYNGRFGDFLDISAETNQEVALKAFNTILGTSITMEQINTKDVNQTMKIGMELSEKIMISGTPTVYFDGEKDETRSKYLQVLK